MGMEGFDAEWFGECIEEERKARGWTLQMLQSELAKQTRGARGTSYGAVWSYINGKAPADPRREVIEGFAELFAVRPEYLLRPGEARTDADATAARQAEARVATERQDRNPAAKVFREAFNPGPAAEAMLWRLWAPLFWKSIKGTKDEDQDAISAECARRIVDALVAPLAVLDALPPRLEAPGLRVAGTPEARCARMFRYIIAATEPLRAIVQRQANAADAEAMNPYTEGGDDGEA
jgi:transcriptional regulator with XRE-family HTH domain